MKHPDESALELYVLEPEDAIGRARDIRDHLAVCQGCRTLVGEMREYYDEVGKLDAGREETGHDLLQVRDRIVPNRGRSDVPGPPGRPQALFVRTASFLAEHPVAVSMGLAAALLVVLTVNFRTAIWKDTNPVIGRGRNDSLVVFNKDNQELWSAWIGYRHDLSFIPDWFRLDNWNVARDVDRDGRNELFSCLPLRADSSRANYLGSWTFDGVPRWSYEFHARMSLAGVAIPDEYRFLGMVLDQFDPAGGHEILLVAEHQSAAVRAVVRVDAATGAELGRYWHHGDILQFASRDLDGDGRKEFYYAGINRDFASAFLGVIDSRFVTGHAPGMESGIPGGVPRGGNVLRPVPPPGHRTPGRRILDGDRNVRVRGDGFAPHQHPHENERQAIPAAHLSFRQTDGVRRGELER